MPRKNTTTTKSPSPSDLSLWTRPRCPLLPHSKPSTRQETTGLLCLKKEPSLLTCRCRVVQDPLVGQVMSFYQIRSFLVVGEVHRHRLCPLNVIIHVLVQALSVMSLSRCDLVLLAARPRHSKTSLVLAP